MSGDGSLRGGAQNPGSWNDGSLGNTTGAPTDGAYTDAQASPAPPVPAPVQSGGPEAVAAQGNAPTAQLGNPEGAWLRVISREASPIHLDAASGSPESSGGVPNAGLAGEGGHPDGSPQSTFGGQATTSGQPGQTMTPAPSAGSSSLGGSWSNDLSSGSRTAIPAAQVAGSGVPQAPAKPAAIPARRRPSAPPMGTRVVGGSTVKLHRVAALDRLASGVGYLTVEWLIRRRGLDLLALQDGTTVAPRGNSLTIDLTQPMNRVLIATGTQGTMPLGPTELRVSNGATQVVVPIDGGTSLGVWPRLTLTRVDEFVVIRHERDPLSGMLDAVANAYGYDERSFVITHTHLLG